MHVAMAMLSLLILWRFLSTPWKMVYLLWFALVVASVLFTWQHHIADIVGGIIVGAISYAAIKVHGDPNVFSKEI
jgi:membrane-associated phospholipid phosphatase